VLKSSTNAERESSQVVFCSEEREKLGDLSYHYPILQPLRPNNHETSSSSASSSSAHKWRQHVLPWTSNENVIRFALYGEHPQLALTDSYLGAYVEIPIKDLVDPGTAYDIID
jgi:hypothetical protein